MRVLILATGVHARGGIDRYTRTLASVLGEAIGPDNVNVLALLKTGRNAGTPKGFGLLGAIAEKPTAAAKIRFVARALKEARAGYDLIICAHLSLAPIAAVAQLAFGPPYCVACYGIEAWRRLPLPERLALKRAALVLPISRFTADSLREVNGLPDRKMHMLPVAVPDELAGALVTPNGDERANQPVERAVVLSVGMLSRDVAYKGFDVVIRALPQVLEAAPNARYVIVGDGDNKENLRKLAAELGVEAKVIFTGAISDRELAAWYHACDVFVLPSRVALRNGRWEGEGFGFVYVEAALAGKPVVGSRDGGASEAVVDGKTGLLVDPTSTADVARALITLLQDKELRARMGAEGQRWARENFSETVLRRRLDRLFAITNDDGSITKSHSSAGN